MRNTKRKNISYIEDKGIIQLVNETIDQEQEMKEYALQETEEAPKEAVTDFWSDAVQMDEASKEAVQERIEDAQERLEEVVSVSTTVNESENKMDAIERAKQALADAEKAKADAEAAYFLLIENSRNDIITDMRNKIAEYRIKHIDLFPNMSSSIVARERLVKSGNSEDGDAKEKKERAPVAVKYRDESGNTWTGRGKQPRWIAAAIASGKTLNDFLV